MASHTEIVNLGIELKTIIGGMGTMTSTASLGIHDAVDIGVFLAGIEIFLHVFMTNHTEFGLAVCPELVLIAAPVRVMTDGAISGADRTMDMTHGCPFLFVNMAIKTKALDLTGGHYHPFCVTSGLVAGPTEQGRRGKVSPLGTGGDVTMTRITLGRELSVADLVNHGVCRQLISMASAALAGNCLLAMETVYPGILKIDVQQRTQWGIAYGNPASDRSQSKEIGTFPEGNTIMNIACGALNMSPRGFNYMRIAVILKTQEFKVGDINDLDHNIDDFVARDHGRLFDIGGEKENFSGHQGKRGKKKEHHKRQREQRDKRDLQVTKP